MITHESARKQDPTKYANKISNKNVKEEGNKKQQNYQTQHMDADHNANRLYQ